VAAKTKTKGRKGTGRIAKAAEKSKGDPKVLVRELAKAATLPPGGIGGGPIDVANVVRNAAAQIAPSIGITPEEVNDALIDQGMDYTEPFAPGRPLNPYFGYNRRPRAWNYQVGRNISTRPRQYRVPFETITNLIQSYDVAQVCIRHIIDDLRSMPLLFRAMPGVEEDVTDEIKRAAQFLSRPDGKWVGGKRVGGLNWHEWLGMWGQDIFRYDGGCLYKRRDQTGEVIGVEVVDTRTIAPLIDYMGRAPESPAPAYLQFVQGLPWDWVQWDDMVYTRMNPLPEDVYGLAPIEAVLMTSNTDLRYQWYWLQYFTEGSVPEGFMEAPPDASTPDALEEWQEAWENWLVGDQSQKVKIRWVPAGSKYNAAKNPAFDKAFPIWLMRHTVAAFGLTPQDLGWTDDVNRSTGETQTDVQFRISTMPKSIGIEAVLNDIIQNDLNLRVQVRFDTGREKEDRLQEAQAMLQYINGGVVSPDEVREHIFGYKTQAEEMIPRFIMTERLGPIPLSYLISVGGQIDRQTGAPIPQTVVPSQFVLVGNQAPDPISTDEEQKLMAIAAHSADDPASALALPPELKTTPAEEVAAEADAATDMSGGTGSAPPTPTTQPQNPTPVQKAEQLLTDSYDFPAIARAAKMWRASSRNQIRKGRKPRLFVDDALPAEVTEVIWSRLEGARTRDQVDAAFNIAKEARISQEDANYRKASDTARSCGTCSHMQNDGTCTLVEGIVARSMVCDYFNDDAS
jgi:hypothetical protein